MRETGGAHHLDYRKATPLEVETHHGQEGQLAEGIGFREHVGGDQLLFYLEDGGGDVGGGIALVGADAFYHVGEGGFEHRWGGSGRW